MIGVRLIFLLYLEKFWNCILIVLGMGCFIDEWLNMVVVWVSFFCFIICCRVLIISGGLFGEVDIIKLYVVGEICVVINSD